MATSAIESLVVKLVGDGSQYMQMLRDAERATSMFSSSIQSSLDAVSKSFIALGVTIATPLSALGKLSVSAFSKFNQAFTESTAIMENLTDTQSAKLKELALNLSKVTTQGPTQLARAFYYLSSAGFDVEQSLKLLPQVAAFATAGMFDLDRATTLTADSLSALGLRSKDPQKNLENLKRITDVLVKGNNIANASVLQLATSLTNQAGPALKVFGKDVEEGVAVLSALAEQGIKGEVAGNALARMLRLLSDAANKNQQAFKELGIRAFDPATGKLNKTHIILGDMEKAFGKMSDRTRTAALNYLGFETRVQTALLPLIGMSKAIKDYESRLRNLNDDTQVVAEKQLKSFSSQTQILYNYIEILAISIGERLAPYLGTLSEFIKKTLQSFFSLSSKTKEFIIQVVSLVGAITLTLTSFSLLRTVLGFLFGGLGLIPAAILAVTVALSTAAAYIVVYAGGWEDLYRIVTESVTKGLQYAIEVISVLIQKYKVAIVTIASVYAIVRLVTTSIIVLNSVLTLLGIKQVIVTALWIAWGVVVGVVNTALTLFNLLAGASYIVAFLGTTVLLVIAFTTLYAIVIGVYRAISSVIDVLESSLPQIFPTIKRLGSLFNGWKEVIEGIRKSFSSDLPLALEIFSTYAQIVFERFKPYWEPIQRFFLQSFSALGTAFSKQLELGASSALKKLAISTAIPATYNIFGKPTSQTNQLREQLKGISEKEATDRAKITANALEGIRLAGVGLESELDFIDVGIVPINKRLIEAEKHLKELLARAKQIKEVTPEAPIPDKLKDEIKKIVDLFDDAGEEAGHDFAASMSKGMQAEFFSFGSQAHLRQIEDYLDRVMGVEGGSKASGGRRSKKDLFHDALKLDETMKDALGPMGKSKGKISVLAGFEERPDRIDLGDETMAQFRYLFEDLNRTFIALAQGRQDLLPSLPLLNLVSSQTSRQASNPQLQQPQLVSPPVPTATAAGNQTKLLEDIKRTNTRTAESSKATSDKTTETNKLLDVLNKRLPGGGLGVDAAPLFP